MDQSEQAVGLTQEDEEAAWRAYEACGSMAEVAKLLSCTVVQVRMALTRDPIRLMDLRNARMESVAQRWEDKEAQASRLAGALMEVLEAMLKHIKDCQVDGREFTDLTDYSHPDRRQLTPSQAYQWIIHTKQLDSVTKTGFNAAKVSEVARVLAFDGESKAKGQLNQLRDPSTMSDAELHRLVEELREGGRPLPWGVQQWVEAKEAKERRSLRAGGKGS